LGLSGRQGKKGDDAKNGSPEKSYRRIVFFKLEGTVRDLDLKKTLSSCMGECQGRGFAGGEKRGMEPQAWWPIRLGGQGDKKSMNHARNSCVREKHLGAESRGRSPI